MESIAEPSSSSHAVLQEIAHLQQRLAGAGYGDLGMWNELAAKHVKLIREHGFENFKRTINFEYHQWSVRSFFDVKSLRLLASLASKGRIPRAALEAHLDIEDALDTRWTKGAITEQRLRAYRFYVGLLWDYACVEDALGLIRDLEEPRFGRPLPITFGGKLITQDLALATLELNDIARQCDLRGVRRVAEIGAGYGRVAWLFLQSQPQLSYHVFDIPPALAVSRNYLAQCFGVGRTVACSDLDSPDDIRSSVSADQAGKAYFHLPLGLEHVPDHSFDLVVNISSFDEMPKQEVEKYFAWIDRRLKGALYLKGYRYNPASGWSYKQFPYPQHWRRTWSRVDPTNPLFIEQVYRVNS